MKLDPENSDLHREMGITFLLAKEWKRARVEMIEAIRHDQTDADAHNGLGYALEKLGDIDGALKEYRTATNLEPDDPTYRTHYFDALVKIQGGKKRRNEAGILPGELRELRNVQPPGSRETSVAPHLTMPRPAAGQRPRAGLSRRVHIRPDPRPGGSPCECFARS